MSEQEKPDNGWMRLTNRRAIAFATAGLVVLGSGFGLQAFADSKTYAHMKQFAASEYHGMHGGRWGRHGRFADMSDEEIDAQIERVVKHVAIEIDATGEQTEKITNLLSAVAKDLKPLRADLLATRQQFHELLFADSIDRQALEELRAKRLEEFDRASKDLVDALADVAEVLTVEQRKVLDERIEQFRDMHRDGRGHWRRG